MQPITPDLAALLKSKFQASASGFRARIEVDRIVTQVACATPSNVLLGRVPVASVTATGPYWNGTPANPENITDGNVGTASVCSNGVWEGGPVYAYWTWDLDVPTIFQSVTLTAGDYTQQCLSLEASADGATWTTIISGPTFAAAAVGMTATVAISATSYRYWRLVHTVPLMGLGTPHGITVYEVAVSGCVASAIEVGTYRPSRVSKDKSLRMTADQAEATIPNEALPLGWGPSSVFPTNSRIRIYEWFGTPANAVRTFTGVIDRIHDSRDPATVVLTCRDMMAIAIDQTFGATAPQGSGETGAVRTKANGVYLSMEVSDIVVDILDRAGWPTVDRAITPTSYVLDEYVIADGTSWADAIIGEAALTGLVGYSAWADELGVFHFAPTLTAGALTAPGVPAYTFRTGEDITALDDSTDQYDLRTRCKIRGPLTTQTLTDTWRELWRTSKFAKPVGIWYDPADAANIRVIDRGTKRLYTLRQSDRAVVSSVYLGSVISSPLGISGDPSDATIYWVLNAPWIYTGSMAGNSVKKVRKSDNVVLATYAIPDGRWSAIKVSAASMWLTNLDTDRFYKRSKVDASAIADYQHTYASVVQANPSGLMIDGTKLHIFWANGGTTARFLVCDEADPATITKVVKTAGTTLHGGEMNTTTHTECWGDSDSLGLVAKFTLVDVSSQTTEVYAEAVDSNLEDELGRLAQAQLRIHDTHPLDAAHAYEVRRETVSVSAVTSLAQATDTAMRRLELLARRRRVVDGGIIGNPALQKTDLVRVVDPVTGIADDFTIDTYRSLLDADSTYLGTLALIPVDLPGDTPIDAGAAS